MANPKPLTDRDGEVRGLDKDDLSNAQSLASLPLGLGKKLGTRGVQKTPTKERITIRLSPEVVERFRATGAGWQTRIDSALKDWLKNHQP